jgi:hypothetical protein
MARLGSRLTKGPLSVILAFTLGSSVTGLAVAGATGALSSSNNVYSGCLKSGKLSHIKVNKTLSCSGGAKVISWNAQGVQGIQGLPGAQGVQGSAGPTTQVCSARFPGADLALCDLTGANLTGANLAYDNLGGTNLTNAILSNVNLEGTSLLDTILTGVQSGGVTGSPVFGLPSGWKFEAGASVSGYLIGPGASLAGVDFTGIDLGTGGDDVTITGANFTNTKLHFATLSGLDLTNTNFDGASTFGTSAVGVTYSNTTCPDGTNTNTNGSSSCEFGHGFG